MGWCFGCAFVTGGGCGILAAGKGWANAGGATGAGGGTELAGEAGTGSGCGTSGRWDAAWPTPCCGIGTGADSGCGTGTDDKGALGTGSGFGVGAAGATETLDAGKG
jgi:hypothetical protein